MKFKPLNILIAFFSLMLPQDQIGEGLHSEELIDFIYNNYKTETVLSYNDARDTLYSKIDLNQNYVYGIYTNYSVLLPNNVDPSTYLYENGMNCEHVWPQSMYEIITINNMKSDMHHLRPCKENVNSYRNNKPFGESTDNYTNNWFWQNYNLTSIPSNNIDQYSENATNIFEPREDVKGDVARSMFYFYTIYSQEINQSFFESQNNTLYQWHIQDPPTTAEINRTWLIAEYQDNIPNPFVLDGTLIERCYFFQPPESGDVNLDGFINVLDIVNLVNYIIGIEELTEDSMIQGDIDNNNLINVIDVVLLINIILS